MEITGNDLRLSNVIWNYWKQPIKIRFISKDEIQTTEGNIVNLHECSGIPITEELLLKMGLKESTKHGEWWIELSMTLQLNILLSHSGFYPYLSEEPEMSHEDPQVVFLDKLNFVHDLQNIVWLLGKKELPLS